MEFHAEVAAKTEAKNTTNTNVSIIIIVVVVIIVIIIVIGMVIINILHFGKSSKSSSSYLTSRDQARNTNAARLDA
jgi:hypothetical protein